MKKSYVKLIVFEIIVLCLLIINVFSYSVINNYLVILFLISLILFFKKKFGVEKINKRYTKDLIIDISIVYIIFFVIYYLFGLITGFYKSNNYFTLYGIFTFIVPNILIIVFKEYFRFLVYTKFDYSKVLNIITFLMFIMLDMINVLKLSSFNSLQAVFYFVAVSLLPIVVNNFVCNYIIKRSSYKVNVFWISILNLHVYILPIMPNIGDYIMSIIRILLPLIIYGRVVIYFNNEEDKDIERDFNKSNYLPYVVATIFTIVLVYFSSGFFRFHAIAIASGSMRPGISKGDIVVIDKKYNDIEVGDIIAYKYNNVVVVHRLIKKIKKGNTFYYTQGDYNDYPDNYVVNQEDIIGIVKFKIPYLGLPTVWLNEL